jgi:hypothetical protein
MYIMGRKKLYATEEERRVARNKRARELRLIKKTYPESRKAPPPPKPAPRPRGRTPKYANEEERKIARKARRNMKMAKIEGLLDKPLPKPPKRKRAPTAKQLAALAAGREKLIANRVGRALRLI